MNVVLTGFGKMGKELYSVLEERGHKVVGVIDPFSLDKRVTSKNIEKEAFSNADVVIDFSSPENAVERGNCKTRIPLQKMNLYAMR